MIPKPPRKEVNVTRMIIYSFIPILSIYAGWRIEKFWLLVLINLIIGMAISAIQVIMMISTNTFESTYSDTYESTLYSGIVTIGSIVFNIYIVRHFARKYNEKIRSTN
jgi:hypothetical protein